MKSALLFVLLFGSAFTGVIDNAIIDCDEYLKPFLKKEIACYETIVNKIIQTATLGSYKGKTYDELATFVDTFGNRLAGSANLEKSIDYMVAKLAEKGLDDVHTENATFRIWTRGNESITLLEPRIEKLSAIGLGLTVGTPPDGITAKVMVVKSVEELEARSQEADGNIVLFNPDYVSYGVTVTYRSNAASWAAKHNAVGALVRSIAPFSINSPHTGMQSYHDDVKNKIPVAALSIEHANMIERMVKRKQTVKIQMQMDAELGGMVTSRNTIAEIKGKEHPEKVVIVSGHLDSWDVGQGAMDDGGGAFISWNSLVLLKSLKLQPRRTLRSILWTAEEIGYVGATQYYKDHKDELPNWNFLMESDLGTFNPYGLHYVSGDKGSCIIQEVAKLFGKLNATTAIKTDSVGSDINLWLKDGIPQAELLTKDDRYFWFHHSAGDTMDVEDPVSLDRNTALWAATAYVLADLSVDFPRD